MEAIISSGYGLSAPGTYAGIKLLNKSNYHEWSYAFKLSIMAKGGWYLIQDRWTDDEDDEVSLVKDEDDSPLRGAGGRAGDTKDGDTGKSVEAGTKKEVKTKTDADHLKEAHVNFLSG